MASRKDKKGRVLRKGESFRITDEMYVYTYTDPFGKRRYTYSKDLVKLREKEEQLKRDQMDGIDSYVAGNADLNFMFDRYMYTKTELRVSTRANYLEIYERYVSSWEYDKILMNNDFDIDWLADILDIKDYRKLENIILQYSSRNDELLFTLGFKYAWSLFMECAKGSNSANFTKLNSETDSAKQ